MYGAFLRRSIALAALVIWPVIPLFWVPVHALPAFFRRLGFLTYVLPVVTWMPLAVVLFTLRDFLLRYKAALPSFVNDAGMVILLLGLGLQIWTLRLLTGPVITGMPEVTNVAGRIVDRGPFAIMRHPTYLSHTLMLVGLFLWSGVIAVGIAAVLDALLVNAAIIPLEERELRSRFGAEYDRYRERVRCRILPFCRAAGQKH